MSPREIILTDQQIAAAGMVRRHQISVLVGGPGTGKTTATFNILNWAEGNRMSILQAAPTGKAAKRMREATGRPASTIHSMLGCEFVNGKFEFVHNEDNPIRCDLLIIDECSMLTNSLLADVLRAVDVRRTKVLFVGDQDQLPSVGAGAVLRDILASGMIPYTELDVIHRNSGTIISACSSIREGESYIPDTAIDLDAESPANLIHVECQTPEETLRAVETIMCERMPARGFDPINDVQVISPVNEKGLLSCMSINSRIQSVLNPGNAVNENDRFRTGDKVINTKNGAANLHNSSAQTYIVNGDIGMITGTHLDRYFIVRFSDPDRDVLIPRANHDLLHAYCITCHRFQGSEAPVIIIPVHNQFAYFLSNSWIYTAISRSKKLCITVGAFAVIEKAIQNRIPNNRCTMLKERIIETDEAMADQIFGDI
jgi:exodeoxyribonuclease V alpha subunit